MKLSLYVELVFKILINHKKEILVKTANKF